MLVIKQLQVQRGKTLLHYDLTIPSGKIITLQGRSGVGKTTLLLTLAGFEQPVSGDIFWQGQSLLKLPVIKRPVTMLFQEHNLFEHLSVDKNLHLGWHSKDKAELESRLQQALIQLEVSEQRYKMPAQLSGGQRQRIALIRTLLRPEPLVLLDEPFAELDSKSRVLAADWVREQAQSQGKTVLLVTHQQEDVERMGGETFILG
ncbi:MAG: ATP-binding cassette domain-containing protein [Thiofilum sp.]|uniref:ATP-binding cassette domain-containing protein n=1 Tax=Thiofilum sp. TaxID=2212733 RepID=UPI0025E840E2|nr:ATP-binding cassette domain-containing protein [Thiofilum sp.]MBK8454942.1 ATP-binding cassette domain-containing protein [Thiofilum sp.]